ncbi:MAG TPA: branched-chain amino acid ABC transporter permease [Deltaproteobacteria bacterium]|nr:branched-chain amino acid ABC transporter permease [Deltaproteobacteria bacterium]
MKKRSTLIALGLLALFVVFPLVERSDYYRHIFIIALMWVVIGSSWNLLAGYTGQISFGHAIFFGVGAYSAGICTTKLGISAWWGMLLGGPMAMLSGLFLGWICFRLRGSYFNLATLAIAEVFRLVAIYWRNFTEGMQGILIITSFRSKLPYYFLALGLAALCVFSISRIMKSKWGFYFIAIREDQEAAEALGISSFRYKSLSLMVSSFFTGLAGAFYMNYMGFIDPEVVFSLYFISIMAILVAMIGGAGTIWGPPVGAFIMVLLQELFRSSFFGYAPKWVSDAHALAFGLLVILAIRYMANGVVGDFPKILNLWTRKKPMPSGAGGD